MQDQTTVSYAAGWYPDMSNPGTERYYNGAVWTAGVRPTVTVAEPKKKRTGLIIGLSIVAFLFVVMPAFLFIVGVIAVAAGVESQDRPAANSQPVEEVQPAPTEDVAVASTVPEIVGLTAREARVLVENNGLVVKYQADKGVVLDQDNWTVTGTTPAVGSALTEGDTVVVQVTKTVNLAPVAPEKPVGKPGTWANPMPQPYVAKGLFLGGEKYSLTASIVNADAGAAIEEYNMFNDPAPAGFKYVIVQMTMTGIDPDGVEPSLATFDLFLSTGEGNRYSNEFIVLADDMPDMYQGPTLYPGNAFTGFSVYIVPADASVFMLYDNSNYIAL